MWRWGSLVQLHAFRWSNFVALTGLVLKAREVWVREVEGATMKSEQEIRGIERSILDAVGWKRLCMIVWRAIPFPWQLIAFPYGVLVYRRLLAASDTLRYLRAMHAKEFSSSLTFRLLRPRYRKVEHLLRAYGYKDRPSEDRRTGGAPKAALRAHTGARRRSDAVTVQKK